MSTANVDERQKYTQSGDLGGEYGKHGQRMAWRQGEKGGLSTANVDE
jgi:hypothetical protein